MLNKLGISTSYPYQTAAIDALSKSAIAKARAAANDPSKMILLPYDNINWTQKAWETSITHKTRTHNEVSALLAVSPTDGQDPQALANKASFTELQERRHQLEPYEALDDILPSSEDQLAFRESAVLHVMHILVNEIDSLSSLSSVIPAFTDPNAMKTLKTEEYYLPTYDQE
jgi:hypothetical protein